MDLPAIHRLGFSLNLVHTPPFDVHVIDSYIILSRRHLRIDLDNVRNVVIDGVTYRVPKDVSVTTNNQIPQGEYITFPNGRNAAGAFATDPSYPSRYFAVSGSSSADYAARKKIFFELFQYAFYSYAEGSYSAGLDYAGSLVEAPLIRRLESIPKPFNSSNAATVKSYRDFFDSNGSHIIHNVNYGARYALTLWASNETPAVNSMFSANVKALFNGIPSGGKFDASIKTQNQYKKFLDYVQYVVSISGGGDTSKVETPNGPGTYADYQKWIKSIKEHDPSPLSFQVIELWTLMKFAESTVLKSYADPLRDAFMWFVDHPYVYKTAVSLDIQSDWAEFNLLTPGGVILSDPANPYPTTNTITSDTRVQWGKECSHDYQPQTLRFFVVNDGSPIDFSISCGNLAGPSTPGKAIVTIENENYTYDVITDNELNTKTFFKAPVNNEAVPGPANRTSKPNREWNGILKDYLDEHATATA